MAISIGSDTLISLTGLYDNVTAAYVDNATVNGALLDAQETTVATFPFSYVTASNGNYQAIIPASTTSVLVMDTQYTFKITILSAGNTLVVYHVDNAEDTMV